MTTTSRGERALPVLSGVLLALAFPPAAAIPVHTVVQMGAGATRVVIMWSYVMRWTVLPFLLGAVLGAALGAQIFVSLSTAALQATIDTLMNLLFTTPVDHGDGTEIVDHVRELACGQGDAARVFDPRSGVHAHGHVEVRGGDRSRRERVVHRLAEAGDVDRAVMDDPAVGVEDDDVVVRFTPVSERPLPHRPLHIRDLDPLGARGCDLEGVEHPSSVTAGEP